MEVEVQKISDHGKNSQGSSTPTGGKINVKHKGHSEWIVIWGKGQKRQSRTMHCSEAEVNQFKNSLKD